VETEWLRRSVKTTPLGITDLILCEVLQGVRLDSQFHPFRDDLMGFVVRDFGGQELAVKAAENYRVLRKRGITVRGAVDCLTATYCIREGHSLLHRDRDFDPFEKHLGLKVIHP
jgi:predicted nucleic acid-binding protein